MCEPGVLPAPASGQTSRRRRHATSASGSGEHSAAPPLAEHGSRARLGQIKFSVNGAAVIILAVSMGVRYGVVFIAVGRTMDGICRNKFAQRREYPSKAFDLNE